MGKRVDETVSVLTHAAELLAKKFSESKSDFCHDVSRTGQAICELQGNHFSPHFGYSQVSGSQRSWGAHRG